MTEPSPEQSDSERRHADLSFRAAQAEVAKLEAEADIAGEAVATEQANRRLRNAIALAALMLMAFQVLAANGIFAWYGLAGAWDIPSSAVTAWMGTTVIEVVSVVLVIVNYLFPGERRDYA
jgi:hypothetical protein